MSGSRSLTGIPDGSGPSALRRSLAAWGCGRTQTTPMLRSPRALRLHSRTPGSGRPNRTHVRTPRAFAGGSSTKAATREPPEAQQVLQQPLVSRTSSS